MTKTTFKHYQRKGLSEMRPWVKGEDMTGISVSPEDTTAKSPKAGDMIARNPKNHKDLWLVAKKYFDDNLEIALSGKENSLEKTDLGITPGTRNKKSLGNTDTNAAKKNVKDIKFWGDGDTFKLISKASSVKEDWMKSTKAMYIAGVGCVVQVTTQQGDNVAEAVVFVPGIKIEEKLNTKGIAISRKLVKR